MQRCAVIIKTDFAPIPSICTTDVTTAYTAILRAIEQFFFFSTFSSSKKFRFSWVWLDAFKAYGLHKDPQCVLAFLGLELEVNFVVRKFNGFIACQNISKEMDTKKS